ncbi:AT-rich interactive domain-containing protein 1-like [Neltuma alba]|uniref:AT-rich interactive domain-containing protein 1-like n=1 Tax=Neltuma alba TaxID=207710 RepID=UPI0010A4D772|nr:AT-rich interactive domain-containing protein 1-like [Prosopis alba]
MARWSIPDDRIITDFGDNPKKFEHAGVYIDVNLFSKAHGAKSEREQDYRGVKVKYDGVKFSFDQFLIDFLKEIHAHNSFRPIPPMLGNGQLVDLKTLFLIVIGKGGYDAVSKNNLWNLVAEKSGLGANIGSSAKLIYCKYLDILEIWLIKVSKGRVLGYSLIDDRINFDRQLVKLQDKIRRLLSDYISQDRGDKISPIHDFKSKYDFLNGSKLFDTDRVKSNAQDGGFLGLDMPRNLCNIDDAITLKESSGRKIIAEKPVNAIDAGDSSHNNEANNNVHSLPNGDKGFDNDDDVLILDPSSVNKENFGRKRKRKSMQEMLCWVTSIAKNPCDPIVFSTFERSKWSSQSEEEIKKQVLLFREAVFMKRNFESSKEQDDCQGMRMHPSMHDDHPGTTCNPREKLKCSNNRLPRKNAAPVVPVSSKIPIGTEDDSKNTQSPLIEDRGEKKALAKCSTLTIPVGPTHQASVPDWTGMTSKSDPKWLGTRIWPLKGVNRHRLLDQRDPIGKGRNDFCKCQVPGSVECVKLHIVENREKVKLELDVAFYQWNFDKVGEEVSRYWTYEEEKKFKDGLKSNLPSRKKSLWDRMFKSFPKKSREDLVNYYFNVFVLRCRRFQNRHSPNNIDSDDDESASEPLIKSKATHSLARKKIVSLINPIQFSRKYFGR